MHRFLFNRFDMNKGPYRIVEAAGLFDSPTTSVSWASLYANEPVQASTQLGQKVGVATVRIEPETDSIYEKQRLIEELHAALELGVRHRKRRRPLVVQLLPDLPGEPRGTRARLYEAVATTMVAKPDTPMEYQVTFECRPVPRAEAVVETTVRLDPQHNLLLNVLFRDYVPGSPSVDLNIWGIAHNNGVGTYEQVSRTTLFDAFGVYIDAGVSSSTGLYTAALSHRITQTRTVTPSTHYCVSFYAAIDHDPQGVAAAHLRMAGTAEDRALTPVDDPIPYDGELWQRYKHNYTTGSAETSLQIQMGIRGGRGYICGPVLEPVAGPNGNPRNFHDAQTGTEWVILNVGGSAPHEPFLGFTPRVRPAGSWRYGSAFLRCESPKSIAINRPLRTRLIGAQTEIAEGRLRADLRDLIVVDAKGRRYNRWPQMSGSDAIVWFEGLGLDEDPEYVRLLWGNPDAPDPARFEAPTGLRARKIREPRREFDYRIPGRDYYYRVSAVSSTGETLASAAIAVQWHQSFDVELECDGQPNAAGYNWYVGTDPAPSRMALLETTAKPRFLDTGGRGDLRRHPRTSGTNPPAPYLLREPLFDMLASTNAMRRYTRFRDPAKPSRHGTWDTNTRRTSALWAMPDGIANRRIPGRTMERADEWELRGAIEVARVAGTPRVQQHPSYNEISVTGRAANGEILSIYEDESRLLNPPYELDLVAAASGETPLPKGRFNFLLTCYNATGETHGFRTTLNVSKVNQVARLRIPKAHKGIAGAGTGFRAYLSPDQNPKQAADIAATSIASYPHTRRFTAYGTGDVAPTQNDSDIIYPVLTQLPAFDVTIRDEDNTATPVRAVRYRLEQRRGGYTRTQQFRVFPHDVHYAADQAPTVEDAVASARVELDHMELEVEQETNGQGLGLNLIDAAVDRELGVNCDAKTVSADSQGRSQLDALTLDEDRDAWVEFEPGIVVLRVRTHKRTTGPANQPIDMRIVQRPRFVA